MTCPARRPRIPHSPAAGGTLPIPGVSTLAGLLLAGLIPAGCSIGIDDRPVPPALIPMAASGGDTAEYGAPAQNYDQLAVMPVAVSATAAPPEADPPAPNGDMTWQTGAQPAAVVETSDLPPPVESASEEGTAVEESVADAAPVEPEPQAETAPAGERDTVDAAPEPQQVASASHAGAFRMAQFVGIEAEAGEPLLRALRVQAEVRGVALDGASDAMVLKTYLSSYPEAGETVLTYVFDVYAPDGTRLTRIDGQEKLPGPDATWADAPPDLVKSVAKKAMRRLEAWQSGAEA